jgi:DNA polymerase zeta
MTKLIRGRVSIEDFVFQKEVRLGTYRARNEQLPPAALVSLKAIALDPRAEPCYGERIPYVVTAGPNANTPLRDLVHHPHEFLKHPHWRLHYVYYITKQILPALDRLFSLVGVDVKAWYSELPKSLRSSRPPQSLSGGLPFLSVQKGSSFVSTGKTTIDQYYQSQHCPVCDQLTTVNEPLCTECLKNPQNAAFILLSRRRWFQKQQQQLIEICMHCTTQRSPVIECDSLDCSLFYERLKIKNNLEAVEIYINNLQNVKKRKKREKSYI